MLEVKCFSAKRLRSHRVVLKSFTESIVGLKPKNFSISNDPAIFKFLSFKILSAYKLICMELSFWVKQETLEYFSANTLKLLSNSQILLHTFAKISKAEDFSLNKSSAILFALWFSLRTILPVGCTVPSTITKISMIVMAVWYSNSFGP